MKCKNIFSTLLLMLAIVACSKSTYHTPDDMVTEALEQGVKLVSPQDVNTIMEGEEIYNLIDVRQKSEHYYGYIPGSVVIPRGSLEFDIGSADFWEEEGLYMPEKKEIMILYCKKGQRSILAAKALMQLGYTNVTVIEGGWKNWELTYPDKAEKNLEKLSGGDSHESSGGC